MWPWGMNCGTALKATSTGDEIQGFNPDAPERCLNSVPKRHVIPTKAFLSHKIQGLFLVKKKTFKWFFNFPEVSLDPIAQPVGVNPELECMPVYSHSKDSGSGIPTVQRHACPPSNHEPSAHLMGSARGCDPFLRVRFTHGP